MGLSDISGKELVDLLKSGLQLFASTALGIQQHEDKRSYGAAGYTSRAFKDLIDVARQLDAVGRKLVSTPTLKPLPFQDFKSSVVNLSGYWCDSSEMLLNISHAPDNGAICVSCRKHDLSGWNAFNGIAITNGTTVHFLVSGTNGKNQFFVFECIGNNELLYMKSLNTDTHEREELRAIRLK